MATVSKPSDTKGATDIKVGFYFKPRLQEKTLVHEKKICELLQMFAEQDVMLNDDVAKIYGQLQVNKSNGIASMQIY